MAKQIEKHGLKITGLRKVSGATCNWDNRGLHEEIAYDTATGECWSRTMIGNNWTVYDDPDVIVVCNATRHMTMQQIADRIAEAVAERRARDAWKAKLEGADLQ